MYIACICCLQVLLVYYFAVYVYPTPVVGYEQRWAESFGWVIATAPIMLCLILGAGHAIYKQKGSIRQVILHVPTFLPTRNINISNVYYYY